jgi:hypothetical protein
MTSYPIVLNGDHAEFEREHANTKPEDRPDWPLPSFDARDWAKAFCRIFMVQKIAGYDTARVDDDEALMITWFANALMRGYDEHAARFNELANAVAMVAHLRSALQLAEESLMNATHGDEYCEYDEVFKTIRAALASTAPLKTAMRDEGTP